MKGRSIALLAAFVAIMLSAAIAAPRNRKSITLSEPTIVGSTTLQPGEYTIEWNGSGPDVQVSFSREGTVIATLPATLEAAQNHYDVSVELRLQDSGARSLVDIRTKNSTLHFAPREVSTAE